MADYLKTFATQADYEAYIATDYPKPNVSYIEATDETIFTNYEDEPTADSVITGMKIEDWPSSLTTVKGNANTAPNETVKYLVKEFYIPEGVTTFDTNAFSGYANLEKITVPSSLTTINENAFQSTANLKTMNLTDLAAWCDVDINSSGHPFIYKNGCRLLLNGAELTDLTIPSGVTAIKPYTFTYCSNLTSLTIPSGVTTVGQSAFANCTSLTSAVLPSTLTTIPNRMFDMCSSLATVNFPSTLTSIGSYAFQSCALTSVTLPEGLTTLTESFAVCSALTSVDLPSTLTALKYNVFGSCTSLTSVTVRATTPPTIQGNPFNNTPANMVIYVPAESVETYKAASGWSTYASQIQAIPTT